MEIYQDILLSMEQPTFGWLWCERREIGFVYAPRIFSRKKKIAKTRRMFTFRSSFPPSLMPHWSIPSGILFFPNHHWICLPKTCPFHPHLTDLSGCALHELCLSTSGPDSSIFPSASPASSASRTPRYSDRSVSETPSHLCWLVCFGFSSLSRPLNSLCLKAES